MPRLWPRIALALAAIVVLFRWILPYLADLAPPGVDLAEAERARVSRLAENVDQCAHACDGLRCPDGWTTALEESCECICKRIDAAKRTRWDEERDARLRTAGGVGS